MSRYCTYFDRGYLAPGLALWSSLAEVEPTATLTVLALDDFTADVLRGLGDERLEVLPLASLRAADPALAAVEATRPRIEFIFALTPCLLAYLLARAPLPADLAYLDADLFFFGSPAPLWEERGEGSVYLVPHRYPPWQDDSARYGRFNVGVVAFRGDDRARTVVSWWREQCLGSTALDAAAGCFGDQKYLDAWPERFPGVVVAEHPGVNLAPWNWARHRCEMTADTLLVDGRPLVVFHFAQFRPISGRWFDSGQLEYGIMPRRLRSWLYGRYWDALQRAEAVVRRRHPEFSLPRRSWRAALGPAHVALLRLAAGQFWFRAGAQWLAFRAGLGRWSGHLLAPYRRWQRRPR